MTDMHEKYFSAGDWSALPVAPAEIVKVSSRGLVGVDKLAFQKRAGDASRLFLPYLKPGLYQEDELPVHMLALGITERFGPNINGDGFTGKSAKSRCGTFVSHAKAYRDHDNTDPAESYGVVKLALYNPNPGWVELLTGLNKTAEAARRNNGHIADLEMQDLESKGEFGVSMGCFTDPATPIRTSTGYKPIIDVEVGDLVWTHKGRWRPVKKLVRRKYTGEVVRWRIGGLPAWFSLTGDHPMFAASLAEYASVEKQTKAANGRAVSLWSEAVENGEAAFTWLHATHLEPGDRLSVVPVTEAADNLQIRDTRLCELLGLYMAEGSLQYNADKACSVIYTVNVDDWAVEGVPALVADLWPDQPVFIDPKRNSRAALAISINSTPFAGWLGRLCGAGSRRKHVPAPLFSSPDDCKLALLGRWLDGDGWCDAKGLHWSSCNYYLLLDARDLLLSLGIPASIYKIEHKRDNTTEYTLNVSYVDSDRLRPWSAKVSAADPDWRPTQRAKPAALRRVGDIFAYRVKKKESMQVEKVDVYNFEVEEDESYSVMGMASHNCKVAFDVCSACGKESKSPKFYCGPSTCKAGGCRDNLGKIVKLAGDFHHLHVDNPEEANLTFNDISRVGNPADNNAYGSLADWAVKTASASDPFIKTASANGDYRHGILVKLARGLAVVASREFNEPALLRAVDPLGRPAVHLPSLSFSKLAKAASLGFVLPIDAFAKLAGLAGDPRKAAMEYIPRLLETAANPSKLASHSWNCLRAPDVPLTTFEESSLRGAFGFSPESVRDRSIRSSIVNTGFSHSGKSASARLFDGDYRTTSLARAYGVYMLTALAKSAGAGNPQSFRRLCWLGVKQNEVVGPASAA